MLDAMYGDKGEVTAYRTGEVLLVQGMDMNEQSLMDWTQHFYGKIIESRSKAKQ